jgi:peptidoglycan-associated lipoprotein
MISSVAVKAHRPVGGPTADAHPAQPARAGRYSRLKAMDVASLDRVGMLADIHFDFDNADIREGDRAVMAKNAELLEKYDSLMVTVEGHCDERGTVEYNLALGERRARATHDYLADLGVGAGRLRTVSYGKEVPLCGEHTEECWQRNRRAHVRITGKSAGQ